MGIGIKELIIILVIVMLLFGTKKIKGIGSDVGGWIRDFRKAMKDGHEEAPVVDLNASNRVIDAEPVPTANEQKNG